MLIATSRFDLVWVLSLVLLVRGLSFALPYFV